MASPVANVANPATSLQLHWQTLVQAILSFLQLFFLTPQQCLSITLKIKPKLSPDKSKLQDFYGSLSHTLPRPQQTPNTHSATQGNVTGKVTGEPFKCQPKLTPLTLCHATLPTGHRLIMLVLFCSQVCQAVPVSRPQHFCSLWLPHPSSALLESSSSSRSQFKWHFLTVVFPSLIYSSNRVHPLHLCNQTSPLSASPAGLHGRWSPVYPVHGSVAHKCSKSLVNEQAC